MQIPNLIIEVTRKCNMSCEHCLRGDAKNLNIDHKYIDSLLEQVEEIGNVTFSGGEPSLNLETLEYFLSEVKRLHIYVDFFYIATNGLVVSEEFVMFCLKMYSYCGMKEDCRVDVSNDMYHAQEGDFDLDLLSGLSFFGRKFENDGYNYRYGKDSMLVNEGRSSDGNGHNVTVYDIESMDDFNGATIYLNCKGEIINGCDWSYVSQSKYKLCDVSELTGFFEKIEAYELELD